MQYRLAAGERAEASSKFGHFYRRLSVKGEAYDEICDSAERELGGPGVTLDLREINLGRGALSCGLRNALAFPLPTRSY